MLPHRVPLVRQNHQLHPKLRPKWRQELDFALSQGLITKEEFDAVLKFDMDLSGSRLLNLNSPDTPIPCGEYETVYHGRAQEVMIRKLLGEW